MKDQIAAVADKGWFESIKEKLNLESITKKLSLSRDRIIEIGLYLGIGFLAGFLFKKYAKYLVIVVITIVALILLQQLKFIDVTINWNKIQGIQPVSVSEGADMWSVYWQWIKMNFGVILSFSVGFFVGFKVG